MKIITWNVNGIRAAAKKGLLSWLEQTAPDILAVQETKAHYEQVVPNVQTPPGYYSFWSKPERKGYSGVALFSRTQPERVEYGFGHALFDREGRVLIAEYERFILYNIYFPNGKASSERLAYKLDFYQEFLEVMHETQSSRKKMIIVCGDFNTAHQEIDLARPKENSRVSGFLPEERLLLDRFIDLDFCDTFRRFHGGPGHYSWWDMKSRARDRNVGWRIDYFFVDKRFFAAKVTDAFILPEVFGSDHCPVGIKIDL